MKYYLNQILNSYLILLSFALLSQSCALEFYSSAGGANTSDGSSAFVPTASIAFTSPAASGESVGWLKLLSGTCSENGEDVVITGTGFSATLSCTGGAFSDYVDVSGLSAGSQSLTASHFDNSTSITINVVSDNCDSSAIRARNYAGGLGGGDGSTGTPYVICTTDQLAQISSASVSDNFSLENDIYFNHQDTNGDGTVAVGVTDTDYLTGTGWTPITVAIASEFNGNSFSIHDMVINDGASSNMGLFAGMTVGSYIHDLDLVNVSVTGNDRVGSISGGYWIPGLKVENVNVSGTVSGNGSVGGVSGQFQGLMNRVTSTVTVSGTSRIGGLIGNAGQATAVINSRVYGAGDISGNNRIGGIAGNANTSYIGSTTNEKNVTATVSGMVGGFVGGVGYHVYIANSINQGTITSTGSNAGGFVGRVGVGSARIENVINSGSVSGLTGNSVGGIVGGTDESIYVANSIVTGRVESVTAANAGEIVGGGVALVHTGTNNWFYSTAGCDGDTGTPGDQACNGKVLTGTRATLSDFYSVSNEPLASFDRIGSTTNGSNDFWEITGTGWPNHWYVNDDTSGSPIFSGAGTQASPYQITSVAEFLAMGSNPRWMGSYYELNTATLDFTAQTFVPIGSKGIPFHGTFDGQSNTIANITYSDTTEHYVGLFGSVSGATIQNLNITSSAFTAHSDVGGLAGTMSQSTVSNISYQGSVTAVDSVGGMIGNAALMTGTNLTTNVTVNGTGEWAGGMVGYGTEAYISKSSTTGTVSGADAVGGFYGYLNVGRTDDCYSRANVSGTNDIGGFIGVAWDTFLYTSYASGTVTGTDDVGGFAGLDHYFRCNTSFAAGAVVGDSANTGAFTGRNNGGNGTYTNCYYANDATCDSDSATGGLQACNTEVTNNDTQSNLQDSLNAPLSFWDFVTDWMDNSGGGNFPTLR